MFLAERKYTHCKLCFFLPPPRRLCSQLSLFVGLFVCLSAGLQENYWHDFHETWWKAVARAKKELIKYWSGSKSLGGYTNYYFYLFIFSLSLTLQDRAFGFDGINAIHLKIQ